MKSAADHAERLLSDRLSLRPPQKRSLEILGRLSALLSEQENEAGILASLRVEFPLFTDFERDFPCFAFALATGVGKTRLIGTFIAYLHQMRGAMNFLLLAPNLTIHAKLLQDFTPGTSKYVFRGIPEFAATPPRIVDGLDWGIGSDRPRTATINILNISKIDAEMRGGRLPRFRSMREELGASPFEHLAGRPDLVLLMDEAHRYRGSAAMRAINALRPMLGLEVTATPFVEKGEITARFRNIVFDYPLARAIEDEFVKDPHVVTREGFEPAQWPAKEVEAIKLEDGIRLHEEVKAKLASHAAETGSKRVKPLMLVVARDTTHAADLIATIRAPGFAGGRYADKVLQVDSSARNEETVERLLHVEKPDEPSEIVVHVNMLKEGWDVSNLYTIVPLRPSRPRVLIEQTIGRGCRLPFGRRTGVEALDRLSIVVHDRYQEVLDAALSADSPLRIGTTLLFAEGTEKSWRSVLSQPRLMQQLRETDTAEASAGMRDAAVSFDAGKPLPADTVYAAIIALADRLPSMTHALHSDGQDLIVREIEKRLEHPVSPPWRPFIARITEQIAAGTIDVPRITAPWGQTGRNGFLSFSVDLSALGPERPTDALQSVSLHSGRSEKVELSRVAAPSPSMETAIVDALERIDGVAYAENADLLFSLAAQAAAHFRACLGEEATKAVSAQRHAIARALYNQMLRHRWSEPVPSPERTVTHGFAELRSSTYSTQSEFAHDFRLSVSDLSRLPDMLFGGFERCLYAEQKFHSDPERRLALVLDRDALKWFRPARGQFALSFRANDSESDYQPDFVAETADRRLLIEVKASDRLEDANVLLKHEAALDWCRVANIHASTHRLKPWTAMLIPHDRIADNIGLDRLIQRFGSR